MGMASLTPAHGWRAFATEIVVVVIGVLLALGAQQLVDDWTRRGEIRDYRRAVRDELANDLGAYDRRLEQSQCVRRRLDQLERWSRDLTAGRAGQLTSAISRPISYSLRRSVWNSQTPQVAAHLPLQERLGYAYLYDAFDNYEKQRDGSREAWAQIREYEGTGPLDAAQRFRLRGLLTRARAQEDAIEINWAQIRDRAASIGIRAQRDPKDVDWLRNLCDPLTWKRALNGRPKAVARRQAVQ